jgi:CRP/FNR family transcriptional regulator
MEEIFRKGQRSMYARGEYIAVEDKVHFIESGTLAAYSVEKGERRFLFAFKDGEIFPYSNRKNELISGRAVEYRALSFVELITLDENKFKKEIMKPQNVPLLIDALVGIIDLQTERIDNLEQSQIYQKLIERLVYFIERLGVERGDKIIIEAPLSHVDIATSIGTTRETVNRYMKQLEKRGVITLKKQLIIINSVEKLKKMAVSDDGESNKLLALACVASLIVPSAVLSVLPELLSV